MTLDFELPSPLSTAQLAAAYRKHWKDPQAPTNYVEAFVQFEILLKEVQLHNPTFGKTWFEQVDVWINPGARTEYCISLAQAPVSGEWTARLHKV